MEEKRMKCSLYKSIVLFMLLACSGIAGDQEEDEGKTGTDYVVVFDVTTSMYEEVVVIPCDFLLCDDDLREKGNMTIDVYSKEGGYSKEKGFETRIEIGLTALKCYLEHIEQENDISETDRICLYFIEEKGIELQVDFVKFEDKEEILGRIKEIEKENPEKSLTPLARALRQVMEVFIRLDVEREHVLIFVTDLNETVEREGSEAICRAAEDIYHDYSGHLTIDDSIMFQCIAPKYIEDINKVSKCFKEYLPMATLIPISTVNAMSFQTYDMFKDMRKEVYKYKEDLEECENEKEDISFEKLLEEQLQLSERQFWSEYLRIFRIPLLFIMLISSIGIILGIRILLLTGSE